MRAYLLLPLLLLAACGPQMQTKYTLHPPKSAQGKECANRCYYVRQGCVDACEYSQHNCPGSYGGVSIGMGYGRHSGRHYSGVGYGSPYYGYDRSCHFNATACTEQCEIQYRQCFTVCGGKVTESQECVENCSAQ